jgi:hypothetical protein
MQGAAFYVYKADIFCMGSKKFFENIKRGERFDHTKKIL